ncbi:hypothetical protein WJX84_003503 [Apatococcus fuscideae]|uniref:Uncharacterized protein n=1 Tax=Apatococcus fuscideae TaxID=2026836 RepID=A0AAW1T2U3_9CHLO
MRRAAPNGAQLHHATWKRAWIRGACGLLAVVCISSLTYELAFSAQRLAPAPAAPEDINAGSTSGSYVPTTARVMPPGDPLKGTSMPEFVLPERGAVRQGLLKASVTGADDPLAASEPDNMIADSLRAQLRSAARPMLSDQMLENAAEQGTRPEMDAAELSKARRKERLRSQGKGSATDDATNVATAMGARAESLEQPARLNARLRSTVSIIGRNRQDLPPESRSWLTKVQETIINNLALKWEDAEEAKLRAGLEDMQQGNPDPVRISPAKRVSNLFRRNQPKIGPAQPADTCAQLLQIPKVAIMFLSRGALHHEQTWKDWFTYIHGHVPVHLLQAANCSSELTEQLQQVCGSGQGSDTISQQHLFSVYVHAPPSSLGFPPSDPFTKRLISQRLETEWGRWSLVEASRLLLQAALQEPLNQRFVLVSESCIPLYPPTTTWQQLLSEEKSRIDACKLEGHEVHQRRWTDLMDFEGLHWWHWRKSSQWFMFTRAHAEVAVNDTAIADKFRQHCDGEVIEYGRKRDCFPDEHYYPTLLATQGRDVETDCRGWVMHVDWSQQGAHPRSYTQREISAARLRLLRMPTDNCGYPAAIKTSADLFVNASTATLETCSHEAASFASTLGYQCPLFARKFPADTADALHKLMGDCRNRLRIINGPQAPHS